MSVDGKRACVVGAGFGGLALAIRLQAAGVATTLIEARDAPGGCAASWRDRGFTFDAGPTAITDPASLRDLWALTGHDMAADVELMPVAPLCRLTWPDGTHFDQTDDPFAMRREVARLAPADLGGFETFLDHAWELDREMRAHFSDRPFPNLTALRRAVPAIVRQRAWRSAYETAALYVENENLRQALSFRTLFTGGNPMTASVTGALMPDGGVWWARGGLSRLASGILRQFERIGGEVRLGDPVTVIEPDATHSAEIVTRSGWRGRFHAIASNADLVHTYRDLLSGSARGRQVARRLVKKRFSPSIFTVHFGVEGNWPGIPHHTMLFAQRYAELFEDVFDYGVLPADTVIYLHHPTVTDPSMAPEGMSTFQAMIPVAHLGKLTVDWAQVGPVLEERILAEIERRLIPDLSDRIVTRSHHTPRDFATGLNAHLGSAFSLEPVATQGPWMRARNRDKVIPNLYLVGAGTNPGAGIPGVIAGARMTAALMMEELGA
ncbi:MAG TPA: phytoene desaturase family protein [Croceibacterium sp.]|nr:phytoene desaturase family protein [Croceibacterium sp.]